MVQKSKVSAPRTGAKSLLTPDNCVLLMIDFQPQMFFGVQSIDRQNLINNAVGLAKSAKVFDGSSAMLKQFPSATSREYAHLAAVLAFRTVWHFRVNTS